MTYRHHLFVAIAVIACLSFQGCEETTHVEPIKVVEEKVPETTLSDKAAIAVKQTTDYVASQVRDPYFASLAALNIAQGRTLTDSLRNSNWLVNEAMKRPELAAALAAGLYGFKGWADRKVGAIATDHYGNFKDASANIFKGRVDDVHGNLRGLTQLYSIYNSAPSQGRFIAPQLFGLNHKHN